MTEEDRAHLLPFDYNDVASLEAAAGRRRAATSPAIIVSAFRHDMGAHLELPDPAFARRLRGSATRPARR